MKQIRAWLHTTSGSLIVGMIVGGLIVGGIMYLKNDGRLSGLESDAYMPSRSSKDIGKTSTKPEVASEPFPDLSRYDINKDKQADGKDPKYIADSVAGIGGKCPVSLCDLSGNGTVTAYDAARLAQILTGIYDLNKDGQVTGKDAQFIAESIAYQNGTCSVTICDITRDGTVSALDAAMLARIANTF